MSTISAAAITDAGYAALVNALATGGKVFPQTARVSATVHEIDRELSTLTDYWWEGDITLVSVIDENTYEARVVIPPDQADDYMRTVGLYLDDGTLFAVSAAKDLPPGAGQELIIQLTYLDIVALTDFQYLSWEDWENQLEIMDKFSQLGNSILENAEAIGLLEDRISGLSDNTQEIDDLENGVSDNTQAINALSGQVSENTADISSLDGRVTGNTSDISGLTGQVAQNTSDISSLNSQVAGSDADITSLNSQVSANTGNISSLGGRVTQSETDISSLNSQVAGNDSDITSLNSQVSTNTGNISSLDGRVTQNETDISSLNSQVAGNDSDISSLNSQVSANTGNISSLGGRVGQNETDIDELQNASLPSVTIGGQVISLNMRKVIDTDITLTCTAASSGADFCGDDALAQALAALDPYEITGNVTIQLADGVYGATTPLQTIELSHKDIDRISIVGNMADAVDFFHAGLPDVANRKFNLFNTDGTHSASEFTPGGNYKDFIVAVKYVNMNSGLYTVANAVNVSDIIGVTVNETLIEPIGSDSAEDTFYLMPANRCQLIFAANQSGFVRKDLPGKAEIHGVTLWQDSTEQGVAAFHARGSGVVMHLSHVIVHGFYYGVFAENLAGIEAVNPYGPVRSIYCHECDTAFFAQYGGMLHIPWCFASFSDYGFRADWAGIVCADRCFATRNGMGYVGDSGAMISAAMSVAMNNVHGFYIKSGYLYRSSDIVAGNTMDYHPADPPSQNTTYGGWII